MKPLSGKLSLAVIGVLLGLLLLAGFWWWQQPAESVHANPAAIALTQADVAEYPSHYRVSRVVEPLHHNPLFFIQTGNVDKPSVLLLHGLGDSASKDWLKVIPLLEKDYHITALDWPGFGLSKGQYFKYSPQQYSNVLDWFIGEYLNGKTNLVGHSMGAAVGLYYAATHSEKVQTLVLVDAAGILHRVALVKHWVEFAWDAPDMPQSLRRLLASTRDFSVNMLQSSEAWLDPPSLIRQNDRLRELVLSSSTNANAAMGMMDTDYSKLDFANLPATHLIWGQHDKVAPLRTAKMLRQRLPSVQLHLIEQAGHVPMKSHPEIFNAILLKALVMPPNGAAIKVAKTANRTAGCLKDNVSYFSGEYQSLTLNDCKLAVLDKVVVKQFAAHRSLIEVNESVLGENGVTMRLNDTTLTATASEFIGAMVLDNTRMDLAGVDFKSAQTAVTVLSNSSFVMSLSMFHSVGHQGRAHGYFHLERGSLDVAVNVFNEGEVIED